MINEEDWSFVGADTKYATHRFHPYPARMVPQIAHRLIEMYSKEGDIVLDPFCGSGTVLLEAKLLGRNAIGFDINQLAILIANAKINPPDINEIKIAYSKITRKLNEIERLLRDDTSKINVETPRFTNIDYWFKSNVIIQLTYLKNTLDECLSNEDALLKGFFQVAFAWTIRQVSNVRKNEYKLYRMSESELARFNPNVFHVFKEVVNDYMNGIKEYWNMVKRNDKTFALAILSDTRKLPLSGESVDLIVTSPPYGDSRTTVAYGQFSTLQLLWLGYDEKDVRRIDEILLGGELSAPVPRNNLPTLNYVIKEIRRRDYERARKVEKFYADLFACLREMHRVLKHDKYMAIVIANRTVRRVKLPTHEIIKEFCVNELKMTHVKTIPRKIPTKRIPWKNAPENIPGLKGETMGEENIIILKKE